MIMRFDAAEIVVSIGKRRALVPCRAQPEGEPDLVVDLDDVTHWQAPDEADEISLGDLQKIAAWIERACDERGLEVEFE